MGNTSVRNETEECKVYFVDDDRGMVQSTVQWLTLSGFKVKAFADPVLLLKTIKQGEACVVVSDIRMPELDGMTLMRHIQTRDKEIPVVLVTGHGDIPLAVEAMKQGAFEFLTKPFSPENLLQVIRKAQTKRLAILQSRIGSEIESKNFDREETTISSSSTPAGPLNDRIDEYEKQVIVSALTKHSGDIASALVELELPRRTLNAKMKKYGISRRDFR